MSETWATVLATIMCTVFVAFTSLLYRRLTEMGTSVEARVRRDECDKDMQGHCHRLEEIERRVSRNSEDIARLDATLKQTTARE